MSKIGLIAGREWRERVRKRSFIAATILSPILIVGFVALFGWLLSRESNDEKRIRVIDNSGIVAPKLQSNSDITYIFDGEDDIEQLKQSRYVGEWGTLIIGANILNDGGDVELYSLGPLTTDIERDISKDIQRIVTTEKLKKINVENLDNIVAQVESKISIESYIIDDQGDKTSTSSTIAYILAYLCGFIMYVLVLRYGSQVMYGVAEEKSSRVVEVLLSSVKPFELMMGKILGVAAVAVTQITIWILIAIGLGCAVTNELLTPASTTTAGIDMQMMSDITDASQAIEPLYLLGVCICFVLFFVGGYLLYAAMFAAVGSACDDVNGSTQFQTLVTMPIVAGLIMMFIAMSEPEGAIAFWGSMIPLTSPIVIISRIPYGVPIWEIVISLILLYATFIAMVYVAGRIYRVGILTYGKRINFGILYRWIRNKN